MPHTFSVNNLNNMRMYIYIIYLKALISIRKLAILREAKQAEKKGVTK